MLELGMVFPKDKVQIFIGTMGFSYQDWRSVFYPSEMKSSNFLQYYSQYFNSVEVDSTFYGTPRINVVKRWKAITPDDFKFCLKTPNEITHQAGLVGVHAEFYNFLKTVHLLGEKLGAVLLQFPPSFRIDKMHVLEEFLSAVPTDVRIAVEVRDQSWYTARDANGDPQLAGLLDRYGICWAATDFPGLPGDIKITSDSIYIRWIGQHGTYKNHDRDRVDRSSRLSAWWKQIQEVVDQAKTVFGFFNNDYAGFAAGSANRFKGIAGMPFKPLQPPQQGILF